MCFICDKDISVHMSHAWQRQSTVIQKEEKKKELEYTLFQEITIKKNLGKCLM